MNGEPTLNVLFFNTSSGRSPVRQWLRGLNDKDRKTIGEDISLVQFRWPLRMPLVRKLEDQLWEIRSHLSGRRIARIIFSVRDNNMLLLHGFIKKTQKTPLSDLNLARNRKYLWHSGG